MTRLLRWLAYRGVMWGREDFFGDGSKIRYWLRLRKITIEVAYIT